MKLHLQLFLIKEEYLAKLMRIISGSHQANLEYSKLHSSYYHQLLEIRNFKVYLAKEKIHKLKLSRMYQYIQNLFGIQDFRVLIYPKESQCILSKFLFFVIYF